MLCTLDKDEHTHTYTHVVLDCTTVWFPVFTSLQKFIESILLVFMTFFAEFDVLFDNHKVEHKDASEI